MTLKRHRARGFTVVELLVVLGIIAALSALAFQNVLNAVDNARTAKTMADIRTVAKAIMHRAVQIGHYPVGTLKVAEIADLLRPYIGHVPTKDGWGNDLHYSFTSEEGEDDGDDDDGDDGDDDDDGDDGDDDDGDNDGKGTGAPRFFRVFSFGKDGVPDAEVVTGIWFGFNSDLVLQEGIFIQSKW